MVRRQRLILFLAFTFGCHKAPVPASTGEPQVRATVVTIRETLQPSNKTYTHALMIANNVARSGDEVDAWRLFDLKREQVTFVDEIAKTYRTAALKDLTKEHREAYAQPPAPELPVAQWSWISSQQGGHAHISMGGYKRELSFSDKTPIPPQLFAFMRASEPAPSPIAGVARVIDEALLNVRGFPMTDHAELPFDDKKLVVDRVVEKIEQKNVPASWFQVPRGFKDVTTPAANRRPAS